MGSFIFRIGFLMVTLIVTVKSDDYDFDVENALRTILTPQDNPTIQLQALRRSILRRLLNRIDNENIDIDVGNDVGVIDRWNKRNLEALARAGLVRTLPTTQQDDGDENNDHDNNEDDGNNFKRSLSSLVRNGQLPSLMTYQNNKRGIQSLARNGELIQHHRSNSDNIVNDFYDNKRNIASLARTGDLNFGKRNIGALARDGIRVNGKRNLPSIKAQFSSNRQFNKRDLKNSRQKRQIDYYNDNNDNTEFPLPVYQNQNVYDYEELMKALTGVYPNTEKRFLGSLARSGWLRSSAPSTSRFYQNLPEKRHIGALARLGWLPAFRNVRRFNRSGRSSIYDINNIDDNKICRSSTADGQTEDNTATKDTFPLDDNKRYFRQPAAVDDILLRRMFPHHPRTHAFITELS